MIDQQVFLRLLSGSEASDIVRVGCTYPKMNCPHCEGFIRLSVLKRLLAVGAQEQLIAVLSYCPSTPLCSRAACSGPEDISYSTS